MRFLYDTAIFVYALSGQHPYRDPCRRVLQRAQAGTLSGEASVELVQEFAHVRMRRTDDRSAALEMAGHVAQLCRLHSFEPGDLTLVLTLLERHHRLDARDAVFAATALNRDVPAILSPDRAFDGIQGLRRIDPLDETAVARL